MTSNDEPKCLRQGKELHKKIQKKWRKDANAYTERARALQNQVDRKVEWIFLLIVMKLYVQ